MFTIGNKYEIIHWDLFPEINGDMSTYKGKVSGYHVFELSKVYEADDPQELEQIYVTEYKLNNNIAIIREAKESHSKISENYAI